MTSNKNAGERDLDDLAQELGWFVHFFNIAFLKTEPVPEPVFSFELSREKSLGHHPVEGRAYRGGQEISIYRVNPHQDLWEILTAVLHCMVHTWQNQHGQPGKSWFHNKQFRSKLAECGIQCSSNGCHTGLGDPLIFLLSKHGIILGDSPGANGIIRIQAKYKLEGNSKLKKWTCGCTNVRVAVNLEAKCLKCGNKFELIS